MCEMIQRLEELKVAGDLIDEGGGPGADAEDGEGAGVDLSASSVKGARLG